MTRPSASCQTCKQRRVKCDGVRPVCGRCQKGDRQCLGFDEPARLILKDETQSTIIRFEKRTRKPSTRNPCDRPPTRRPSPAAAQAEDAVVISNRNADTSNVNTWDLVDAAEWFPSITNPVRITPVYERDQVALNCCRETISLRTLSWVMSDEKWIQLLPDMMSRSESLASIIHANAATYLAKARGAKDPPQQALAHYSHALRGIQKDLYDPIRQKSDETLFAIILLAVFDIHNSQDLGSWQAHIRGATRIIQCNGSEYYKSSDSAPRVLAKYVRGFDIIRAMSNQEETVFGYPEWNHLAEGSFVRPIDSLLTHYSRITNIMAQAETLTAPTMEELDEFVAKMKAAKKGLEDWKKDLPEYYEPVLVPTTCSVEYEADAYAPYPYGERLDYLTNFIGHTMNLYKAAILRIDRHLLGHIFPLSNPSPSEVSLAKEIVMSFPGLTTVGGIFILYPAMRAAKVLGTAEKQYLISTLRKISREVPVAAPLAAHIMEFEMIPPTDAMCNAPLAKVWGPYWDIKGNFLGSMVHL